MSTDSSEFCLLHLECFPIVRFTIRIGDPVSSDENVMEIVTNDDVVVTVKAPESGQITEIYVSEGETVKAGQDLFKIERC